MEQLKTVWTDPSFDPDSRYERHGVAADYELGYSTSSADEEEEDEEGGEEAGGEGQEGTEDQPEVTHVKVDPLAELVFRLSIFFATEAFVDSDPGSSLLVYFSSILGIREDGPTFRRAKEFTPLVAGLIYNSVSFSWNMLCRVALTPV